MVIETDGLVIREQNVGESDRLIWILTAKYGLIRAFANRAKSMKSKMAAGTQLLSYSDFTIYQGRAANSVNSAQVKNVFFNLRTDMDALSLSLYLCELFGDIAPEGEEASDLLHLLLNSLYLLAEQKRNPRIVKATAELRAFSDMGYMPNLIACDTCGTYESNPMYFHPGEGLLYCKEHGAGIAGAMPVSLSTLTAMRYIIYSDAKKIFDFTLTEDCLKELNKVSERFVLSQAGHGFKTLDFLNSLPEG